MVLDRPPTRQPTPPARPLSRTGVIVGMVVAAYVAFAIFAQLIGEDANTSGGGEAAQLDGFCTALYADYPGILTSVAAQGDFGGPFDEGTFYSDIFSSAGVVPAQFQDDVATLTEGLQRAANGELSAVDVDSYIETYEDLRTEATPLCNQVGQQVELDELTD